MRHTPVSLLSVSSTLLLAAGVSAQGDECTGALSVVNGSSGPYSSVGSTTSSPAWPCGAGGSDVWFDYVALGAGSLTIDLCGSSYDTTLEVFDGSGGCGGLVSLGCNDDTCGLQSSVTVTVSTGQQIFFRVGGFASQTGSFVVNVNGPTGGGGTVALRSSYGTGCVAIASSFYELLSAAAFDLNGVTMTGLPTAPGYINLPIGSYVAPTGSAAVLALTDDSEVTQSLTTPFPYDGGIATSLTICSNGFVSVATGNGVGFTPSVGTMLNNPQTGWYNWHDFNPTGGGGQVKFEEIGQVAYITWDGVRNFAGSSTADDSTWQFQFNSQSGSVAIAWQSMAATGTDYLVGYSPGGPSMAPTATDISAALPGTFSVRGNDVSPLALSASARPIAGSTINLDTANIPTGTIFGGVALGFTDPNLNLQSIGMDGCTQYADHISVMLFFPAGQTSASVSFSVPAALGVTVRSQSFAYDPTANLTTLGAIASNGLSLLIGNL